MANIFKKSGNLFLYIVLGITLFSSTTNAIPLRKNNSNSNHHLPEFITIRPSESSMKKHDNPDAQSAVRIGITPEQQKAAYELEVISLSTKLKELAEKMLKSGKYVFEKEVKEYVFREEGAFVRINVYSRVCTEKQTIAAGNFMKGHAEIKYPYDEDEEEDDDENEFSPFLIITVGS